MTHVEGDKPEPEGSPTSGEFWQTEADPRYGHKLFQKYDHLALGYEFGIQGHGIYYSGQNFCWYSSPKTEDGIERERAEWVYDHVAYELGYRISFEDHHGHLEDELEAINNSRSSYFLYEADYGDGVRMLKIDFHMAQAGQPMRGEGAGLVALMDAIQQRVNAGTKIKFVTPKELREIFDGKE